MPLADEFPGLDPGVISSVVVACGHDEALARQQLEEHMRARGHAPPPPSPPARAPPRAHAGPCPAAAPARDSSPARSQPLSCSTVLVNLQYGPGGVGEAGIDLLDGHDPGTVVVVGAGHAARAAGLSAGCVLRQVNGVQVHSVREAMHAVSDFISRGGGQLALGVEWRAAVLSVPASRSKEFGSSPIYLLMTCDKVTSKGKLRRRILAVTRKLALLADTSGMIHRVLELSDIAALLVEQQQQQADLRRLLLSLDPLSGEPDVLLQIRECGAGGQGKAEGDTHHSALAAAECVAAVSAGFGHQAPVRLTPGQEIAEQARLAESATRAKATPQAKLRRFAERERMEHAAGQERGAGAGVDYATLRAADRHDPDDFLPVQ